MSAQGSGDRSLVASLFSERSERISLTRGELAYLFMNFLLFVEKEGLRSQLASTSLWSSVLVCCT